jgi:hypothetical protein
MLMGFTLPESMDECLYFSRRTLGKDGKAVAWVEKKMCPQCKKAKMGKPVEKGSVKIRAPLYRCPACGHEEEKKAHEESCDVKIMYTCPFCKANGEAITPYKRKKLDGVDAFVFECTSCKKKLGITKKMKEKKGEPE